MNAVAKFEPPRLPYHPAMEERFGVDAAGWKALVEAVWPAAKSPDSVALALSYCKARNLDPFKKPVHIVPVWSTELGRMTEGVWPGISELRTTAMRTSQYAGCDETEFGPEITREFAWSDKKGAQKATVTFPEWARCTVYRMLGGNRVAFVGPKVRWLETYATAKRDTDAPNEMWRKRPEGQIEKCAEAAALRKAFPEELGNEYAAEEMAGRAIGPDASPVAMAVEAAPPTIRKLHAGFEEPQEAAGAPEVIEGEFTSSPGGTGVSGDPEAAGGVSGEEPVAEQPETPEVFDVEAWAAEFAQTLGQHADVEAMRSAWDQHKDALKSSNPSLWRSVNLAVAKRAQEIGEGK